MKCKFESIPIEKGKENSSIKQENDMNEDDK